MDSLSADVISCVGLRLSFQDCVKLQLVSKRFMSGLRRNTLWERWGALSYEDMCQRARKLSLPRRVHLWSLLHLKIDVINGKSIPSAVARITKELLDLKNQTGYQTEFDAGPVDARVDMCKWRGVIFGKEGSVFEGGVFDLTIDFTFDYPFKPPRVRFATKVYHPNVNRDGYIQLCELRV
jgi:hypothetical protein